MDYKVIELKPFQLLVKKKSFAIDAVTNNIPDFWDEQIKQGVLKQLKELSCEAGVYGACSILGPSMSLFEYGIGVKVKEHKEIPGLDIWRIDHRLWAVFECGNVEHIGEIWKSISDDLFVDSSFERVEELDFEYYPENAKDFFCELYIPIKKSKN